MYVTLSSGGWSNSAEFTLGGSKLDPEVVSRSVGIEPSRAWKRGDPIAPGSDRARQRSSWTLDSRDVLSPEDADLDEHLCWLLDQLEPCAEQLRTVVAGQELKAQFWSAVEMDAANVDFELTPGTLGRIAALGATLRLDIYAPEDVERDVVEIPDTGAP